MANSINGTERKHNVDARFISGKAGLSAFLGGIGDTVLNKLIRNGLPSIEVCGSIFYSKEEVEQWMFQKGRRKGDRPDATDNYDESTENASQTDESDEEKATTVNFTSHPDKGYRYVSTRQARIYGNKTTKTA